MGWDKKKRGNRNGYFYRSERIGKSTKKVYIGTGAAAELASRVDQMAKESRRTLWEACRTEKLRWAEARVASQDLRTFCRLLTAAALLLAGHHQHHGLWRRRRYPMSKKKPANATDASEDAKPSEMDSEALKQMLTKLVEKANSGEPSALDDLRRFLDEHPEVQEVTGDLARHAERAWLDAITQNSVLGRETATRKLNKLKTDLAGPHPTALEKLLVDEIGVCYLAKHQAEMITANSEGSVQQAAYRLREVENAQRRLFNGIRLLALLRDRVPKGLAPLESVRAYQPVDESRERA